MCRSFSEREVAMLVIWGCCEKASHWPRCFELLESFRLRSASCFGLVDPVWILTFPEPLRSRNEVGQYLRYFHVLSLNIFKHVIMGIISRIKKYLYPSWTIYGCGMIRMEATPDCTRGNQRWWIVQCAPPVWVGVWSFFAIYIYIP